MGKSVVGRSAFQRRIIRKLDPRDHQTSGHQGRSASVVTAHPLRSMGLTLGIQLISFVVSAAVLSGFPALVLHLTIAAALGHLFRLSRPWQGCNLLIPLGIQVELSAWIPLGALVLSLLVFAPALRAQVPFYPTRRGMYAHVATVIAKNSPTTCVDLGSGFGSLLFTLAKQFPHISFVGYEIGLVPFLVARLRSIRYPNTTFYLKSFWEVDLSQFDCIYAFLSPPPMSALEEKLRNELAPDALFLSNSFPLPNAEPFHTVVVGGQALIAYRRESFLQEPRNLHAAHLSTRS